MLIPELQTLEIPGVEDFIWKCCVKMKVKIPQGS